MPFNPWMRARCGKMYREQSVDTLEAFEDGRLCRLCWRAMPKDEQSLLFEHAQR
jgi:hypothetical protein